MRVFTASIATETNTFGPLPTGWPSWLEGGYAPAGRHPDHMTFFAAPLWALRQVAPQRGWTVVEGLVAGAQPSGVTPRAVWQRLRDELLADLRAAGPVDLVLLGLHGAMVADGVDDCEGDLLAAVRAIVGPQVVVGAELDPHTHLSAAMVQASDLLVAFKHYPHTDMLERAHELLALAEATVQRRIRPTAGVADTGAILVLHTTREPARGFVQRIQALEGHDGVLSISVIHGFPYGDVPDMGTQVLVYTDGDAVAAQALARRLADELLALRDALETPHPDMDQAFDQALALPGAGPAVLADRADNPGSGSPGDSTYLLRRLLERAAGPDGGPTTGLVPAVLGPVWDAAAVRTAFEAGEGAQLALRLGGKTGPSSGEPLDTFARVVALRPAAHMTGLGGTPLPLGDAALLDLGHGVQVVLVSQRQQAMGTDLFTQFGVDLAAQRTVVVKSAQHFQAAFGPLARGVVYVGAPGAASPHLHTLPYQRIRRPKWPLDAL